MVEPAPPSPPAAHSAGPPLPGAGEPAASAGRPGAAAALVLLLVINLFNYIDRYVLAAVTVPIRNDLIAADDPDAKTKIGSLATWFLVAYMLTAPLFGWLAGRMSRWTLIGLGVIGWSLASGASGLAPTFVVLVISRICVGMGEAAYGPAAPAIIADSYPVERRGRVLAWFYMAIPVGSALGYTLGGAVESVLNWRWAFYVVVPPGILLGVLCFFMREPARAAGGAGTAPARLSDYAGLLRIPSYVLNTAAMTAMTFAMGGMAFWMPEYIHAYRGAYDSGTASTVFGVITAVGGLVGTLVGGRLGDRLRSRMGGSYFVVSGAGMLIAFPMLPAVLVTPFPWAWVWIFLAVFCLFLNTGPTNTALANVTRPSMRAQAFALNILIIHAAGDAISPAIMGRVLDATGGNFDAAFLVVSGAVLVGGVIWIVAGRYLAADTAAVEAVDGGERGAER